MTVKVSVIVPTYNRKHFLEKCLNSLFSQNYPKKDYEIIVADDGSKDKTEEYVKSLKPQCRLIYIKEEENKGRSKIRNIGARKARSQILAFTDDDCMVSKNWIKQGASSFKNKEIGGVKGRTITDPSKITPLSRTVISEGEGNHTCNIFYRKDVFDEVGGFKLRQFREDTDIAYRVLEKGYKVISNNLAVVTHLPHHYSIKQLLTREFRLKKGYWDMYLAKRHKKEYKKSIAIAGVFSPSTIMNYPFYLSLIFSIICLFIFSKGVFIMSLILLGYVYVTSVLIQTNEYCRSITFRQMAKYKRELLQLLLSWWIVMLMTLWYHIKGMIKFKVLSL